MGLVVASGRAEYALAIVRVIPFQLVQTVLSSRADCWPIVTSSKNGLLLIRMMMRQCDNGRPLRCCALSPLKTVPENCCWRY